MLALGRMVHRCHGIVPYIRFIEWISEIEACIRFGQWPFIPRLVALLSIKLL
jgi:hypothetical protein